MLVELANVHLSRVRRVAEYVFYLQAVRVFPGRCIEHTDEKRVYYAIRLEVKRVRRADRPIVDESDAGRRARRCLRPRA